MKWQTAWQLVKDVLLTGTGLYLIISQVLVAEPSGTIIVAGLALLAPAAATHAATVLSGSSELPGGHGPSSPSAPSPSSSPPSLPAGGTGEHGA